MPAFEVSSNDFIVKVMADSLTDVLGTRPEVGAPTPIKYIGTDAGTLSQGKIPGVVCGVGNFTSSIPDEYVEVSKIVKLAKAYALAFYRVTL